MFFCTVLNFYYYFHNYYFHTSRYLWKNDMILEEIEFPIFRRICSRHEHEETFVMAKGKHLSTLLLIILLLVSQVLNSIPSLDKEHSLYRIFWSYHFAYHQISRLWQLVSILCIHSIAFLQIGFMVIATLPKYQELKYFTRVCTYLVSKNYIHVTALILIYYYYVYQPCSPLRIYIVINNPSASNGTLQSYTIMDVTLSVIDS